MTLWELKPNQACKINSASLADEGTLLKIKDLGVRHNETVTCLQWIPFGGPRLYHLQNGIFAIEKTVAQHISVEVE